PVPPPPPPPPPPLPPSGGPPPPPPLASSEVPKLRKEDQKARNALLADIQQGTRLRKVTQINDRSAPQIEKPKGANRDGVNPVVNKGGSQQPLGGLFAGGFPVLRPAGQRDMTGRPGQVSGVRAAAPKHSAPANSGAAKPSSNPSHPAEGPRAAVPPEPPSTSRAGAGAGAGPGRPSLPAPPPPPPASSKPTLTFPPPPPLPPPADRPPKGSPHLLSQFHKPSNIQSLPLPPTPGHPQPAAGTETRKKRPGRGAGTGAGKLVTPPQPPARSPTTELTSKSGVSAWATAHDPYPPLKNGNMHIIDDFESKFTFHSVEDFPPPDEFKPFQKIYPSKIAR
ncbi:WAS/WASL-interacting protein family member 3, partial [Manacus vitellinus]